MYCPFSVTAAGSLPARPQSPPFRNLGWHSLLRAACPHRFPPLAGCFHCCGQPARTASKPSPLLDGIHCCGQPAHTASKPSLPESWMAFTAAGSLPAPLPSPRRVLSLLRAACPHGLKALPSRILDGIHCCEQPARTASKPSLPESWMAFTAAGSLPTPLPSPRESRVLSLLRAACPHGLKALPSGILDGIHCCGQLARIASLPSQGAFTAAGSLPARPQSPPLANLGWQSLLQAACPHRFPPLPGCFHCCGQPVARPQSPPLANLGWHSLLWAACPHRFPPLANLGCFHCCGQPASTPSKPSPRESWMAFGQPARTASKPSLPESWMAFTAAGSLPAPLPSPHESWVLSLLRATCQHPLKALPSRILDCIHCCGQPARTASKTSPRESWGAFTAAGSLPAPLPSPHESWVLSLLRATCQHPLKALPSRILDCIHCCGQPARTASKTSPRESWGAFTAAGSLPAPLPSPHESWVLSLLRATCQHPLKALPSRILDCIHCCGQPARTASKTSPRESWGAFTAAGSLPAPLPSPHESWVLSLLRATCQHPLKALPSRILGAFTAAGSLPPFFYGSMMRIPSMFMMTATAHLATLRYVPV